MALRYTELNPVRAGLVARAEAWPWSSAGAHCDGADSDPVLEMDAWKKRWSTAGWRNYLAGGETKAELMAIRQCTHTGRPLGTMEFVRSLELATSRRLLPQKGGRPAKASNDGVQRLLAFEE